MRPIPRVPRLCEQCQKPMLVRPCDLKFKRGRFCSRRCNTLSQVGPKVDIATRFWAKVDKTPTCWLWTGAHLPKGYGIFGVRSRTEVSTSTRRTAYAHRVSWEMAHGPIPPGLYVLHHCDTPACVRPDHLFIGTTFDNQRDCVAKNRHRWAGHFPKKRSPV